MAKFNEFFLIKLPEKVHIYNSVESVDINKDRTDHIPQEFLQSKTSSGLSLFRLNLKEGPLLSFFATYILPRESITELK